MLLLMFDLGHMADPLTKCLLHFFWKNKMSVIHGEKAVLSVVETLHLCIEYISTLHNIDNPVIFLVWKKNYGTMILLLID